MENPYSLENHGFFKVFGGLGVGPAPPSHQRTYATETNATVQRQQKILGHLIFSDEGLTLETSAKRHIPQAKNIPYQPFFDQIRHQREDCHVASNMTLENQSRMDVHKRLQRSSFLDPKSKIRIGCWDVRTNQARGWGGGYSGQVLLGMCR